MKALAPSLRRLDPARLPPSSSRMYTDPDAPAIKQFRDFLFDRLRSAPSGSVVPIEFNGVDLSASCHSAILGPALRQLAKASLSGRYILGLDPLGRNSWDADAGLRKESEQQGQKLVCVWDTDEGIQLVGAADQQVRSTFEFVHKHWASHEDGTTARDLADAFGVTIQVASNRLARAAACRILHAGEREAVKSGGTQYRYLPVG